jgi:hypothetical protein
MAVDFDEVRKNAQRDGVNLAEIAIIYENLSVDEVDWLREKGLLATQNQDIVIARFPISGPPPFQCKAARVLTLGAT